MSGVYSSSMPPLPVYALIFSRPPLINWYSLWRCNMFPLKQNLTFILFTWTIPNDSPLRMSCQVPQKHSDEMTKRTWFTVESGKAKTDSNLTQTSDKNKIHFLTNSIQKLLLKFRFKSTEVSWNADRTNIHILSIMHVINICYATMNST
jgi:hypothetical protein